MSVRTPRNMVGRLLERATSRVTYYQGGADPRYDHRHTGAAGHHSYHDVVAAVPIQAWPHCARRCHGGMLTANSELPVA